jgi:hypothetical protein
MKILHVHYICTYNDEKKLITVATQGHSTSHIRKPGHREGKEVSSGSAPEPSLRPHLYLSPPEWTPLGETTIPRHWIGSGERTGRPAANADCHRAAALANQSCGSRKARKLRVMKRVGRGEPRDETGGRRHRAELSWRRRF